MTKKSAMPRIIVRSSPLQRHWGVLQAGPLRMRCALGRAGTTPGKREGDGATPIATMRLLALHRRFGRLPGLRPALPATAIRADGGWCDAPDHGAYNRAVRLPFPASAERLLRPDRLYDVLVVLDWNVRCRSRGRGSAIFLHVAAPGYGPTEGCVAVAPRDFRRLQPFLAASARLTVLP